MVNVILSWSGDTSKQVAEALREWIPKVIQRVEPWLSTVSIRSGGVWFTELFDALKDARFMIGCMTPDNLSSPYIMFEAGAVVKGIGENVVCPYLYQVQPSQLCAPLTHFQARLATREDTLKLMKSLNESFKDQALQAQRLDEAFNTYWPELEQKLRVVKITGTPAPPPSAERMLEEILETVRALSRERSENVPILTSGSFDVRRSDIAASEWIGARRAPGGEVILTLKDPQTAHEKRVAQEAPTKMK